MVKLQRMSPVNQCHIQVPSDGSSYKGCYKGCLQ